MILLSLWPTLWWKSTATKGCAKLQGGLSNGQKDKVFSDDLVTGNGSQFTSHKFKQSLSEINIKRVNSCPIPIIPPSRVIKEDVGDTPKMRKDGAKTGLRMRKSKSLGISLSKMMWRFWTNIYPKFHSIISFPTEVLHSTGITLEKIRQGYCNSCPQLIVNRLR